MPNRARRRQNEKMTGSDVRNGAMRPVSTSDQVPFFKIPLFLVPKILWNFWNAIFLTKWRQNRCQNGKLTSDPVPEFRNDVGFSAKNSLIFSGCKEITSKTVPKHRYQVKNEEMTSKTVPKYAAQAKSGLFWWESPPLFRIQIASYDVGIGARMQNRPPNGSKRSEIAANDVRNGAISGNMRSESLFCPGSNQMTSKMVPNLLSGSVRSVSS